MRKKIPLLLIMGLGLASFQSAAQMPRVEIGRRSATPFDRQSPQTPAAWSDGFGKTFSCQINGENVEEIKSVRSFLRQSDGNYQIRTTSGSEYFIPMKVSETCALVDAGPGTKVVVKRAPDPKPFKFNDADKRDFVCHLYQGGKSVVSFRKRVVMASQNKYNGLYTLIIDLGDNGPEQVVYPPRPGEICEIQ